MKITILNSQKKHNWFTFILVLSVIVLAVLLFRSCGQRKTWEQKLADKEDARQKAVDSTQAKANRDLDDAMKSVFFWRDSAETNLAEAVVLRYERDQSWKALGQSKQEADKLIGKIRELNGADSADCLELANNYEKAAEQVIFYKGKSDLLVKRLDTAGHFKDKIISKLQEAVDTTKSAKDKIYNDYTFLKGSFDRLSPHWSGWIGAETTVLNDRVLAGMQAAYQSKKGTQIIAKVGLDSKDVKPWGGIGILWKISFR